MNRLGTYENVEVGDWCRFPFLVATQDGVFRDVQLVDPPTSWAEMTEDPDRPLEYNKRAFVRAPHGDGHLWIRVK